jgi:hypothetical protein
MTIKVISAAKTTQDHKAYCSMMVDDANGGSPVRLKK